MIGWWLCLVARTMSMSVTGGRRRNSIRIPKSRQIAPELQFGERISGDSIISIYEKAGAKPFCVQTVGDLLNFLVNANSARS